MKFYSLNLSLSLCLDLLHNNFRFIPLIIRLSSDKHLIKLFSAIITVSIVIAIITSYLYAENHILRDAGNLPHRIFIISTGEFTIKSGATALKRFSAL